jgi:hypothetical protein
MNAVEVSIDGERIGVYVPPAGGHFSAMVGNIPRTYMRAHIMSGNDSEDWQWQLPDVQPGQTISFRLVEAAPSAGVPPQFVRPRHPRDVARCEREGKKLYARARKELAARKRKKHNHRRQRTSRVLPVRILRHWRESAAPERSAAFVP